jgi:hypothetical protein
MIGAISKFIRNVILNIGKDVAILAYFLQN